MPRLRRLAPWLLTAAALAALATPHVPKDILNNPYTTPILLIFAALVVITSLVPLGIHLLRRRRARPTPPTDPAAAHQARRALDRSLAAARRLLGGDPARTWLILGPPAHGKSTVATALLGELHDLTQPHPTPLLRCLVATATRTLVLEHPGTVCELRPLLRQRRPLDAILLVVSLESSLDSTIIKTRIREILEALAVDVPIHLICTKLDHLAGHSELVGATDTPWALALAAPDHLPAALRTLSRWVDVQRLAALASEPTPERRARLFTFAAAFARACERLADLTPLFTNLSLRTVFFLAARRDAAPRDLVLHDLATQLHLPLPRHTSATHPSTSLTPQPTVLTALLAHDSESTRTPAHHRRRARLHHAAAATLALAALTLILAAPASATRQRTCLQTIADTTAPLTADTPDLPALHALHTLLTAPDCADPTILDTTFRRAVRRHLLQPHHTSLARALTHIGTHPPATVADQLTARDALRAYLLLTADPADPPGPLDPVQRTWLTTYLATPESSHLLTTFFTRAQSTDFIFPRDRDLINRTRQLLNAHSDDDATLHAALAAADAACEPLALRALTHAAQLTAARPIPCSFTRPGWDLVQQQLSVAVDRHDSWILGRPPEPRDERLARLRDRYDTRYIGAWTDFLASVRVRRPTDQASAMRLLAELTADDHPLTRVFAGLDLHTRGLGRTRADLPTWIPDTGELGEVHRAFAPLLAFTVGHGREPGLARWHARLAEVHAALEAASSDPAALPALRTQISAALADTQTLLRHADIRRFRPLLTALLLPPLEALQSAVTDQDKLTLVRTFCHELHAPLRDLGARYPFTPTAADDATLADFTALFHPETGAITRLRTGDLAPYIIGPATDLAARPVATNDPHPLHPRIISLLRRASTVSQLAFPGGQLGLDIDVDLRCNADIGRVTLELGATRHAYTCGPDPRARLHWPADTDGARLELLGRDGRRQQLPSLGPWALFRLLEKDIVTPQATSHDPLVFRFDLRASRLGQLDVALTPTRTAGATLLHGDTGLLAPLRTRDLQSPPDTLFTGLPACPDLSQ